MQPCSTLVVLSSAVLSNVLFLRAFALLPAVLSFLLLRDLGADTFLLLSAVLFLRVFFLLLFLVGL